LRNNSNFCAPKPKRTKAFWKALLEEFNRVIPPESALLGSAILGPEDYGTPNISPIMRLAVNPVKQWHSERPRDEFGFVEEVSPVSEEEPLVSSSCVSPLEEDDGLSTSSLIDEDDEFSTSPSTTRSEICPMLSSFLLLHEYRFPPATAPVVHFPVTTHPDTPGTWQQRELSPFSVSSSTDDESLGIHRADSPDSPWEEEFAPPAITVSDNRSTIGQAAITPRLFLEELSLPNSTTGKYEYTQSPTFTSTGYGTFVMHMPFTPRSPTWSEYSETDILLVLRDNVMNEYLGDEDFSVWDEVFLCIGALMFFAAVSTYVFALLLILKYSVGV
jgi:hypothetical protein